MQQQERIESLHQQAAANYLQGDFGQALKFWQDLLRLDPDDERALEGVRLCELLSEEGDLLAAVPAPRPASLPVAGAEAGGPAYEDEPDFDLSALDFHGAPAGSTARGSQTGSGGGLDFGDLPPIDLDTAAGDRDGAGESASVASAELQVRIDELVLQATRSYDAGDPDTALETLSRVFILDDANPAGLALQRQIQTEGETHDGYEEPEISAAIEQEQDADEPVYTVPDDDLDSTEGPGAPVGPPSAEFDAGPAPAPPVVALPRATRKRPALRLPRLSRSLVVAAAGLMVVAVGGWFGYSALFEPRGGATDGPAAVGPPPAATPPASEGPKAKQNKKGKKGAESPAAPAAPVYTAEQVPQLLADARAAAAAGDYAAAIVGFNAIVSVDPAHADARGSLADAAEKYRKQQEYESKMNTATTAWDGGDYTTAMRIFYRLPEAQGDPVFTGYIRDGWYNLGIQSLGKQDCDNARSHLEEYRAMAPKAPELAQLFDLAGRCGYSARDPGYRVELERLPVRPLVH